MKLSTISEKGKMYFLLETTIATPQSKSLSTPPNFIELGMLFNCCLNISSVIILTFFFKNVKNTSP